MQPHSIYAAARAQINAHQPKDKDPKNVEKTLRLLAWLVTKDRTATMRDVKTAMETASDAGKGSDEQNEDSESMMEYLAKSGYLRDDKRWLTKRGFEAAGAAMLREILRDLASPDPGEHPISHIGTGENPTEQTRPYELGDDMADAAIQETLLNAYSRSGQVSVPVDIQYQDVETHQMQAEAKVAVAYCIDLSSTMRTRLKDGASRMEAARRALWCLYELNHTHYPRDVIHIIGFASMASRIDARDIPYLQTFDANDGFLHYTNYQAALRLARRALSADAATNKRIVMITDGHPSACDIENPYQKETITSDKPYANFYKPDHGTLEKLKAQRRIMLDTSRDREVYLCYRYKKVDGIIDHRTVYEARRCQKDDISIDFVVISDEAELIEYAIDLAARLNGKAFSVQDQSMSKIMIQDYMTHTKRVITPNNIR